MASVQIIIDREVNNHIARFADGKKIRYVNINDQLTDEAGKFLEGMANRDGLHLEVLRVCTDGAPNACSMLYGAVRRAAIAMGYPACNVITYTLASEPGTSLRAAGWRLDKHVKGESWDRPSRGRKDNAPTTDKLRWRAA